MLRSQMGIDLLELLSNLLAPRCVASDSLYTSEPTQGTEVTQDLEVANLLDRHFLSGFLRCELLHQEFLTSLFLQLPDIVENNGVQDCVCVIIESWFEVRHHARIYYLLESVAHFLILIQLVVVLITALRRIICWRLRSKLLQHLKELIACSHQVSDDEPCDEHADSHTHRKEACSQARFLDRLVRRIQRRWSIGRGWRRGVWRWN
mmetsp:Transcript_54316/g.140277  ORF Transcript_54316/g.140277 Transcript_54316/m.140277 type:complete len:206 (+) Transcript_54316:553-1170(+)